MKKVRDIFRKKGFGKGSLRFMNCLSARFSAGRGKDGRSGLFSRLNEMFSTAGSGARGMRPGRSSAFFFSPAAPKFFGRAARRVPSPSGRTLLEMLAVLAIIGVLSITALVGFTYAMNKHRANETIYDVMLRGTNVPMIDEYYYDKASGYEFRFPGLVNNGRQGTYYPMTTKKDAGSSYYVEATGVTYRVCELILKMNPTDIDRIMVGDTAYAGDSDICGTTDGLAMKFCFGEDGTICDGTGQGGSSGGSGSGSGSGSGTEDPCDGIDCGLHGVCNNGVCDCTNGYKGVHCEMPPACTTDEECTDGEVCTDYECVCPSLDTPTECQEITSVEDGCDQLTNLPNGTVCSTGVCLEGSCCNPDDSQECCEAAGRSWEVSENNGMGKCCKEGEMAIDGYCRSSCYVAMLNAGFSDTDFTIENSTVTYHTGEMHIDKDLDISTCDLIVKEAGLSIASNKYLRVNNLTSSASYLYNNDDAIFILSGAKITAAGSITASTKGEGYGISNSGTITAGDFIKVTAIQTGRIASGILNKDDAIIIAKNFISIVAEGENTTGIRNLGTIEAESITSIAEYGGIYNYSSILTENSIYGEGYSVGIESNGEKLSSKNGDIIGKGYLETDGVQGSTLNPERITAGGIIKSCSKMNSCICYQPWRSVVDCN